MAAVKVMPVDLNMHMGLSRRAAMRHRLGATSLRQEQAPTKPSVASENIQPPRTASPPQLSTSPLPPTPSVSPVSFSSMSGTLKKKKRVVFADDKGLALTDVRLFTVDPPEPALDTLPRAEKPKDQASSPGRILRLRLGFPQPCADLASFLGGLAESLVHLESCSLTGGSLSGTVRACNISLEKVVHIRITFNSWRSYKDVPCTYVQQHPGAETELFFFNVPFPSDLDPQDRVEFRVLFRPGCSGTLLWDDNGGKNYRVLVEATDREEVPSVRARSFLTQSPKRLQAWPVRRGPLVHYPACLEPLSSLENMMIKPLTRQDSAIPLC